jgi:antibiotic biosynthesis monooxygenase (ABM) superfamily enzyme
MNFREQAVLNFGVWLAVYPSVLLISMAIDWLGLDLALWLEILFSTALTVPLISYVAVPALKSAIAKAEGKDPSELKS